MHCCYPSVRRPNNPSSLFLSKRKDTQAFILSTLLVLKFINMPFSICSSRTFFRLYSLGTFIEDHIRLHAHKYQDKYMTFATKSWCKIGANWVFRKTMFITQSHLVDKIKAYVPFLLERRREEGNNFHYTILRL